MSTNISSRSLVIDAEYVLKAQMIVQSCAEYLCDDQKIARASSMAEQQSAFPALRSWQPESVAQGNTGLAIVCAYLNTCLSNHDWEQIGHHHLALAIQSIRVQKSVSWIIYWHCWGEFCRLVS